MAKEIVRELVDGEWVTTVGTGGGGGGGSDPVVGPFTVTHADVDAGGIAPLTSIVAGQMVYGVAMMVTEAFNDGGGSQGSVFALDNGVAQAQLTDANFDFANTSNLNAYGNFGNASFSPPSFYRTASGLNPTDAGVRTYSANLLVSPAGTDLVLFIAAWAGDATDGSVDIYLWIATPTAP